MSGTDQTTTPTDELPLPVARDDRADALALLSDDERAALELVLDGEATDQADDEGDDDDQDEQDEGEADAGQAPAPDAKPEPGTEQAADAPAAAAAPAPAVAPLPAAYDYKLPDDFEARTAALEGKYADLQAKMEEGEISTAEYGLQLRELNREDARLEGMRQRAEMAEEMRTQAAAAEQQRESQGWTRAIDTLVKEVGAQKIEGEPDYANDEAAGRQLGAQVNAIMVSRGIEPNSTNVPEADKLAMLRQARRELYYRLTGNTLPADAGAQSAESARAEAKKAKAAERRPKLEGLVPPVSSLPGAGGNAGEEAEFESINGLEGEAYENAVATMRARDPAKFQRFLAS